MNATFLQLDLSKVSTRHQIMFPTICNTYDFDDIKIFVVWPKSAILKMGPKGLSQGQINGAFWGSFLTCSLTSVPNFISI